MAIEINELKQMLKHSTAVLILDNGDPSFVVLDYATYKRMLEAETGNGSVTTASKGQSSESELLERINKDILALKEQIEEEEKNLGLQE
ncbi:MAG: hypothetical protein A2941_03160 [Candidatus Yanofskybacteria bacterium RIFCSPLOWO2_01_FULL_49_17]|uniref:Antitoxin n=1 Tax=Candidatus Yanofskybacteria bacterium RIFCSPLOWO2_01_FULL_49_17 TaxID=1802700 RepID=A0A1F8GU83_9BACT|nr:MAG: hypothetical protein A2941_03160 [Candidatus Yanofskybacteria bacterium RIFCSPLOWO2_01_FULL_49_17]